jgi:hypothetical protein
VRRMQRYLRGHGLLGADGEPDEQATAHDALSASAVSGQTPPAGPQWVRGLSAPVPSALGYDKTAVRFARRVHAARCNTRRRRRPFGTRSVTSLRASSAARARALRIRTRGVGAHRAQACVRGRHGRSRHGPAFAVVPSGRQCASASLSHREVRGRAGVGERFARALRRYIIPTPLRSPTQTQRHIRSARAIGRGLSS